MRTPTIPVCVILSLGDSFFAVLMNPSKSDFIVKSTKDCDGPYEALGIMQDSGYDFSKLHKNDIPKWIMERVQTQYLVVGYCHITKFPF